MYIGSMMPYRESSVPWRFAIRATLIRRAESVVLHGSGSGGGSAALAAAARAMGIAAAVRRRWAKNI